MIFKLFTYVIVFLLGLLSIIFFYCHSSNAEEIKANVSNSLRIANEMSFRSDVNLVDFQYIDSVIKDKRIIVLGEQQHGDGTTQQLYSNLVLYLHKKGYTNLYLEAPFYKTAQFWDNLSSGQVKNFTHEFYPFWSNSQQTSGLRDSIVQFSSSNMALSVRGLDFQIPTIFSQKTTYDDIISYMNTVPGFIPNDFKHLRHSLTNRYGPVLYFNLKNKRMEENRKSCLLEFKTMQKLISKKDKLNDKDSVFMQYLNNLYHFYYAKMYLKGGDYNNYRDSVMYENFVWQMEKNKSDKSIIWTANRHAADEKEEGISMGAYIKNKYRDSVFSILTTSFSGYTTNIASTKRQRVNPATEVTIENIIKDKAGNVSFFTIPENINKENAEMRFYGYHNLKSNWFVKCDAFFFIKNMKPNVYQ